MIAYCGIKILKLTDMYPSNAGMDDVGKEKRASCTTGGSLF
jgi:hypothetical protein